MALLQPSCCNCRGLALVSKTAKCRCWKRKIAPQSVLCPVAQLARLFSSLFPNILIHLESDQRNSNVAAHGGVEKAAVLVHWCLRNLCCYRCCTLHHQLQGRRSLHRKKPRGPWENMASSGYCLVRLACSETIQLVIAVWAPTWLLQRTLAW